MIRKKDYKGVKKTMGVESIQEGMLAGADVYNNYGTIIIRKFAEIKYKHVSQMKVAKIHEMEVFIEDKVAQEFEDKEIHINDFPRHVQKLKAARIMIVDDAMLFVTILTDILEEAGFNVVGSAANGREALDKVKVFKPTLITLDIEMPEMDGISAIAPLLGTLPGTKIVMLSSVAYEDKIKEAMNYGAVDFIIKPFDPEKVKIILIKAITGEEVKPVRMPGSVAPPPPIDMDDDEDIDFDDGNEEESTGQPIVQVLPSPEISDELFSAPAIAQSSCPKCGGAIKPGMKFCTACGKRL